MERFLVKYSLWVVIILVHMNACKCCLETERIGLLELKAFIKSVVVNPDEILISWVNDKMSDCCGWKSIKCNSTTRRVIELSLNSSREVTYYSSSTDEFAILNVSLFHPFEELLSLDLSYNWFNGWVGDEGSENFLSLKKLEVLNLGYNFFNKSIFPYLSPLTSLKTLILSGNDMGGSLLGRELANLRNLENLDLSSNGLNGSLPTQGSESFLSLKKLEVLNLGDNQFNNSIFPSLSPLISLKTLILSHNDMRGSLLGRDSESFLSLKKLEVLNLDGNNLNNSILSSLSPLTSLKTLILGANHMEGSLPGQELINLRNLEYLDLSYNFLNGSLPTQGLCEMKNLVELDLSSNEFSGSLPECLRNLTYLRVLDLTGNQLSGNIPSVISNLTSLEYLSLSHNNFGGLFSFSSLANHSKLQVFQLSSQSNKFYVETENFPWLPTFQLKFMQLTNCNLTRTIPRFLLHQYDLRFIDLSHNNLVGMFPTWLLQNNSKLEAMYLMNNSLTGTLQLPTSVQVLDRLEISSNGFDGELPKNIGMILSSLSFINMSRNSFEGSIPSSIGEMRRLLLLDLSNNNFSGDVPRDLFTDCISLQYLKLSDNSFHGEVIPNYMNLISLWFLYLNNNSFSGKVGNGLLNSTLLQVLDMSNNKVSGAIPVELCSLRHLHFLDLSQNMLSGSVPSSFNLPSLRSLYLQKNGLSGPIPQVLSRSSSLVTLDLRDNNFSGSIPNWINRLPVLSFLLLGGNQLHGHIPNLLCGLRNVWIMDLSRNKLYGSIPSCFNNMSFGLAADDDGAREFEIYALGPYSIDDDLPRYNDTLGVSHFIGDFGDFLAPDNKQGEVEFTTKSRRDSYKGGILMYMAGLDLSCNELTGDIPRQLGDLQGIRALNLSHNSLSGSIPESLSNLTIIESLDLSNNNLSGQIPPQLAELNFLSTFNVSYNNLSGTTPDTGQFGTFIESSYEGNPSLCVSLTKKGCTSLATPPSTSSEAEDDETVIDLIAFYWSFAASFVTIQLGLLAVLCINPHWRRAWFHFTDVCIYLCFRRPMKSVYLAMKKCIAI